MSSDKATPPSRRSAVFFDVDGTLVPGTSSGQHIAQFLGHVNELRVAEDAYARGEMNNEDVSELDARSWAGFTPAEVAQHLRSLPLVHGIDEVVAWCRERELVPFLATLAWEPVGTYLCDRFGFEGSCGPTLTIQDGRYTGAVAEHLNEFGKRDAAEVMAASIDAALADCGAIGDSRSDLPLFEVVGYAVAFNASPAVQNAAAAVAAGLDLRAVVPLLQDWHLGR